MFFAFHWILQKAHYFVMFFVRMDEPETNSVTFSSPFRVFAPPAPHPPAAALPMGRSPVGRIFSPEAAKKHRVFHTFTENPALLAPLTRPNTNPEEYRQNQT